MEFGTREILIVLGIVIILGILLDGLRRVRHARTGTLKVSRRRQSIFDDESIDDLGGDLPIGNVRVKSRDEESAGKVSDNIRRYRESNAEKYTSAYREKTGFRAEPPRSTTPVPPGPPVEDVPAQETDGPFYPEGEDDAPGYGATGEADFGYDQRQALDDFAVDEDDRNEYGNGARGDSRWVVSRDETELPLSKPFHLEPPEREQQPRREERKPFWEDSSQKPAEPPPPKEARGEEADSQPVEVIVLHVMAKKGTQFEGTPLLDALLANGLRYGDMGIFHRHETDDGSGPVHFSLANSVNPGTFDLAAMDTFRTRGVTLFMPLDGLKNPLDCYAQLVKTAQVLARTLDGELKDETRSVLTKQTIEHYRQQIIEYTRRSFTLSH